MLNERQKKAVETYMSWVGPLGNVMFYLQAFKIFTTEKANDISLLGFVISAIALTSWLIYGLIIKDKPLILANVIGTLGALLVLTGVIIYT